MDVAALLGVPALAGDMDRVESALSAATTSMDPFLSEVAGHLVRAGGKRIRPMLTLAAALAGGAEVTDDVIQGGISVELVHIGSLYHDDVMDEADSRRGVQSVNARWGNLTAILAGDFLLAKASEIAASLGVEVAGLLAATIGRLCEGQVGELRTAFDVRRTEAAYLDSISGKTASLTASACRIGGIVSGLPRAQIDALTDFGEAFGMVFQIRDDCLDVTATDEDLGKPAGQDLVEGTYSLPVLRALAHPEVGDELRPLLGRPLDPLEMDKARAVVRASGGVESALGEARRYADRAAAALVPLGEHPVARALADAGHTLLDA
ncbi:MAG TPA: polyprenyl synthetase family protein [Acidimicrobiales bacterium]|nr:polyprenyl synthetase family protein [Acidimicrobiales bacterium]